MSRFLQLTSRAWSSTGVRHGLAAVVLCLLTVLVAFVYATGPRSPRDLMDRVALLLDSDDYGAHSRVGACALERAREAALEDRDSVAERARWDAAIAFARAARAAPDPTEAMAANDRAADVYLTLGWDYLEGGRGSFFGLGRDSRALQRAETVAACAAALAPTHRRREIDELVQEVEDVLDRPLVGPCPH